VKWLDAKPVVCTVVAAFVAGVTVYVVQQQKIDRVQAEILAPAVEHSKLATEEAKQPAAVASSEVIELARLRNEVAQLRREQAAQQIENHPATPTADTNSSMQDLAAGKYIPKEQLSFVGYNTPEATLQSMTWRC
jgi:hypothetical protein